jgi:hypothetical protein
MRVALVLDSCLRCFGNRIVVVMFATSWLLRRLAYARIEFAGVAMATVSLSRAAAYGGACTDEDRLGRKIVYLVRQDEQMRRHPKDAAYVSLASIVESLQSKWYHRDTSLAFIKKTIMGKVDDDGNPYFHVMEDAERVWIASPKGHAARRRSAAQGRAVDGIRGVTPIEQAVAALKADEVGAWNSV